MSFINRIVNTTSIRYQLFTMVGLGILIMLLLLLVSSALITNQKVKEILINEGYEYTRYLALNSKLALLYSSAENLDAVIKSTLSFEGVQALGVYTSDYKIFTSAGKNILPDSIDIKEIEFSHKPVIFHEDKNSWFLISAVKLDNQTNEMDNQIFKTTSNNKNILGYACLVIDKSTLKNIESQLIFSNLAITSIIAILLLIVIHIVIKRLIKPLKLLSKEMHKTEHGEYVTHISTEGPYEVRYIADAYNRMINGLAERDQELRAHNIHLKKQATHDHLTGLMNRIGFKQALLTTLEESKSIQTKHVLCYLDLDKFKIVNDSCGHAAGDELLKAISGIFISNIRKDSDILARIGGDEFAIILKNCSLRKAINITNKICEDVRNYQFHWDDRIFSIGASIGIMQLDEKSGNSKHVRSQADKACYTAKQTGRGRVHVIEDDDSHIDEYNKETSIADIIQDHINNNKFHLSCQKIQSINTSTIKQNFFEVLLHHPETEALKLTPTELIQEAEQHDLAIHLDKWVIRNTLASLSKNIEATSNIDLCKINITASSLCDNDFYNFIIDELKTTDVNPEKICFEISEDTAISNMAKTHIFADKIHGAGCSFSLNDLGSSNTSFEYLRQLKTNFIKINSFYINNIINDPVTHEMVRSINEISHILNIKTIAKSVENTATLDELKNLNIDYAQGLIIEKPVSIDNYLESIQ